MHLTPLSLFAKEVRSEIDLEIRHQKKIGERREFRYFTWEGDHGRVYSSKNRLTDHSSSLAEFFHLANTFFAERNQHSFVSLESWDADKALLDEIPHVVGYGPFRVKRLVQQKIIKEEKSLIYGLLHGQGPLSDIEAFLIEKRNTILRTTLKTKNKKVVHNLEKQERNIIDLLESLVPNIQKIHIQEVKNLQEEIEIRVAYQEGAQEDELISFQELSSGHQSILDMLGDLLIRLFESQPEISDPHDLIGIVLIDEIETHLHPSWQREFPHLLSQAFPKIQFIASTHTPLSLLGAPENSVFLKIKRTSEEGCKVERMEIEIQDLSPNILLTSDLFDLRTWHSVQNKKPYGVKT